MEHQRGGERVTACSPESTLQFCRKQEADYVRPSITLVTCLFDLSSWEAEHAMTKGRPRLLGGVGGYLSLAQALLRQPIPLVIFTEPSLVTPLSAIRPPNATTRYCA